MSDEAKQPWTPGEWEASPTDRVLTGPMAEDFADWIILVGRYPEDDEGMVVARAYNDAGQCTKANAHLMAAAPAMAEALALFIGTLEEGRGRRPDPLRLALNRDRCEKVARAALELCGWKRGGR